jgi:hypothetical protein
VSTPAESVHAVLSAGNGGLALAGDLAGREYRVRLYEPPDLADPFETIRRYGFATIAALARLHGVATPLLDGLLTIANTICGEEFARLGWWPDQLDLETLEFVAATTKCQAGIELR